MALISQNHFQFIIEIGLIILSIMVFALNLAPISLSIVTFLALFVGGALTLLFGVDMLMLILSFGQNEFTHPFGPIALLCVITSLAALKIMESSGVNTVGLKKIVYLLIILITIFGGLMHRSFLLLWLVGLFVGYFILSKSFREKSVLTVKKILMFVGVGLAGFGLLELVSIITNMSVFSPLLRIGRIETFSYSSLKMVINNTQLIGHIEGACFWGKECLTFSDGYIGLPISLILLFGLPYPLFSGLLVSKKDVIDYMLPGIFGYAFDFGYIGLLGLGAFVLGTIFIGFKLLSIYREKREKGNKKYLGREVLLIGSLTAFIAQAMIGLFIMTRAINGLALITFIILGSLVLANAVSLKKDDILSSRVFG